jgi:hypothetical protein
LVDNNTWIRKRWWEFRHGHSVYLIFGLTFSNFILISYRLLVEQVPFTKEIFPELWFFAIVFVLAYIPISTLVGFWHRKTQVKIETTVALSENPTMARYIRTIIDIQTGVASEQEVKKLREFLIEIEKKK